MSNSPSEITMLSVGAQSPFPVNASPFTVNFNTQPPMLVYTDDQLDDSSVNSFNSGAAHLSLADIEGLMNLVITIEGFCGASDLFYHPSMEAEDTKAPNFWVDNAHQLFNLVLIERSTNTVRALRAVTVTPSFLIALRNMYAMKLKTSMSEVEYIQTAQKAMSLYTPDQLVKKAVISERMGITEPKG
tara:strand:+ start:4068 stop:4628 length:561 start_codon:yes stop_codon:yes gene_type:complete